MAHAPSYRLSPYGLDGTASIGVVSSAWHKDQRSFLFGDFVTTAKPELVSPKAVISYPEYQPTLVNQLFITSLN
jgi:hypothetical protein